ncbi:MAG TPA: BadF/BadG/BcrA/BcrD ATPase family protein [Anaerolineales bacterium]|jgi:N-acetylglucosamine kinase-like BadF-type ATPase
MLSGAKYFLGVDVGGTKSHALISGETGQALGLGAGGPGNWESIGLNGLFATLADVVGQACRMAELELSQISGAGMGLAGYDWPSQRSMLLETIQPLGLDCPLEIVNDAALGIFAGATQGWGVSVTSGTGCNCRGLGKDRHSEGRMIGGAPEWSGEYAGGYDILDRAMRAVTFEWGKRGPATGLSQAILHKTGARSLDELVENLYLKKYSYDPSYVKLVFEVAAAGDPEALDVMRWAGDQLGQMACGVIRQLGLENEPVQVVLIGKNFDGHPLITESMRATILNVAPAAQLVRLTAPPVTGGVLLGMEQVLGQGAYLHRDRLLASANALLNPEAAL